MPPTFSLTIGLGLTAPNTLKRGAPACTATAATTALLGHAMLLRKQHAKLAFWLRIATSYDAGRLLQAEGRVTILSSLKSWARTIKRDVVALWIAARDPRVPLYAKAAAGAVAAYALSPVDLIPDFIPALGYLDDLVIVPLGILLVVQLIPAQLMEEFRQEALRREEDRPTRYAGLAAIVALWVTAVVWLVWLFWPNRAGN
jgi:uncharacterized membrane protein YkvA (DUF1232 family)